MDDGFLPANLVWRASISAIEPRKPATAVLAVSEESWEERAALWSLVDGGILIRGEGVWVERNDIRC